MCMLVYVSNSNFCEDCKFRMKCVEKYDVSAEGARQKFFGYDN